VTRLRADRAAPVYDEGSEGGALLSSTARCTHPRIWHGPAPDPQDSLLTWDANNATGETADEFALDL
jgi:hypothetical protein